MKKRISALLDYLKTHRTAAIFGGLIVAGVIVVGLAVIATRAPAVKNVINTVSPVKLPGAIHSTGLCAADSTNAPKVLDHVIVIAMENKSFDSIIGPAATKSAPYINSQLVAHCGSAHNYVDHVDGDSLPNYMAMTSGVTQPTTDCIVSQSCNNDADNIFSQVAAAGKSWKTYAQGMSGNCSTSGDRYAARHNPPAYLTRLSSSCGQNDLPMGQLTAGAGNNLYNDLQDPSSFANYTFVAPDLCKDMHDACDANAVTNGDTFLSQLIPIITASPTYTKSNTVVFIWWDEAEAGGTEPVPFIAVSPWTKKGDNPTSPPVDHCTFLHMTEDMFGISNHLPCGGGPSANLWTGTIPTTTPSMRSLFHLGS